MNEISFKELSMTNKSLLNASNSNLKTINGDKKDSHKHNQTSFLDTTSTSKLNQSKQQQQHQRTREIKEPKAPFYPPGVHHATSKSMKKVSADNNLIPYDNERETLYSTWTPLSDENTNVKLFDERKQLFLKWFETWNDNQRRQVIEGMLSSCKPKQLFYTRDVLNNIAPIYNVDFTRILPRVICLYIFSFLDPRSLCRCAQVCWYWKMLTESDQLWMPKCLRFGWNLNYIPTSFENGIWKQFYIENIKALQYVPIRNSETPLATERSDINLHDLSYGRFGFNKFMKSASTNRQFKPGAALKQPPWRANNSNPNHFYRFNYLDEDEKSKKEAERLMKSLTLDSASKKMKPPKSSRSNRPPVASAINTSTVDLSQVKSEHHAINKSIDDLITQGNQLIEQIKNSTGPIDPATNSTSSKISIKSGKLDKNDSILSVGSKSSQSSIKQAWNLLDKGEYDES